MNEAIRRVRESLNTQINLRNDLSLELAELRGADERDDAKIEELRAKRAEIDAKIKSERDELAVLEREAAEDEAVARLQANLAETGAETGKSQERSVEVTEPRTYTRDQDPSGQTFLRDVASAFLGGSQARERLERHMTEERVERGDQLSRGVDTSGVPGFVIPQYLVDLYAPQGRPGRKLADQMRHHDLPATGMTVYIPRQTAQTEVAEQEAELNPVTEEDYENELIPITVRTAAGAGTLSRQAVERGLGTEDIVMQDLLAAYHNNLGDKLINAPSWGLDAVAQTVTYTDAEPTAFELYRKILAAGANIEDILQDQDEDQLVTVMRGRRWTWMTGEATDKKPFVQHAGKADWAAAAAEDYKAGIAGYLPNGTPAVKDNHIKTVSDQDTVYVVARNEAHLWEDPKAPLYIRAETGPNMKSLGIDLLVYGYFAACFTRVVNPSGATLSIHQKITGTGLATPVF